MYKGTGKRQPYPLLLIHGWPGSFYEFADATPILAAGLAVEPGYDVVIPSLPGFVFSDAPKEPGINFARMAYKLYILMKNLGYDRFGVQGGDWGYIIGNAMCRLYPDTVVGYYMHNASWITPNRELTEEEKKFLVFKPKEDSVKVIVTVGTNP